MVQPKIHPLAKNQKKGQGYNHSWGGGTRKEGLKT